MCFKGSMQYAEDNYQNCWYKQSDYEALKAELDKHHDALDSLNRIDASDCSEDVYDCIGAAILDLTPPEKSLK